MPPNYFQMIRGKERERRRERGGDTDRTANMAK